MFQYWKHQHNLRRNDKGKEIWYDLDNPDELKIAREVSPVNQIENITKPLFIIQGANDPRVNIAESDTES